VPEPRLLVVSSLFPHAGAPIAGVFVRERMFRVGRQLPLVVVSPRPWFPGQGLIRRLRPGYRPPAAPHELQAGVEVHFPRFFALPGLLRRFDGFFMALAMLPLARRLQSEFGFNLIDAHFAYPDGYAASLLGRWLGVPVTVTLRGTELKHSRVEPLRARMARTFAAVDRVFSVSDSLRQLAIGIGLAPAKALVVGNGVDTDKFHPEDRAAARARWQLASEAPVLVGVGALVERKGFHRVIECLPALRERHPGLRYLVVGGPSPEGDMSAELRAQVARLQLEDTVVFCGPQKPEALRWALSAADVFVLATANEGWANVFLEAMACGLPVVTTDVGGNREVVCDPSLGIVVPFGDAASLHAALDQALATSWDRAAIVEHARRNSWDDRVRILVGEFRRLTTQEGST